MRDVVACVLCAVACVVMLWLACGTEPMRAQDAVRLEHLTARVEYLTRQVELERRRADVSEQTARACSGLLDALKGAVGVGP